MPRVADDGSPKVTATHTYAAPPDAVLTPMTFRAARRGRHPDLLLGHPAKAGVPGVCGVGAADPLLRELGIDRSRAG